VVRPDDRLGCRASHIARMIRRELFYIDVLHGPFIDLASSTSLSTHEDDGKDAVTSRVSEWVRFFPLALKLSALNPWTYRVLIWT
jgi:hypothetical protein